jgi:serine/threonine-protein kinase
VDDPDISHSVSTLPPAAGHVLVEAVTKPGDARTRYTLSRLHAEGGIGRVWLGHDRDLNRDVALKELKPHQAAHPDACRRFLKEAQITGQLEHPNIVPVYELARRPGDDQPFYTKRFVRGQTLPDAIADYHQRRRGQFVVPPSGGIPPTESEPQTPPKGGTTNLELHRLLNAFVSVCHAIAFAHSRGVVHRDLKPANVVLGGFGEVLVLDWGIAKVAGATDAEASTLGFSDEAQTTATQTGALLGTPVYMAPEQAGGRAELIDARTDIYGLGGNLFAIVTGKAPRRGKDTIEVISQLLDNPTPRVRSVDPHVPVVPDPLVKTLDFAYSAACCTELIGTETPTK